MSALVEAMNGAALALEPSAIRQYAALAKTVPGCVSLTLGEPGFDTPEPVRSAVGDALAAGETHYIENPGARGLREAIAAFEADKNAVTYSSDEVIATAGATEALAVAFLGVLSPGDEVVVPQPAFGLYAELAKLCRATVVPLDTAANGFQITAEALSAAVGERTRALVLNSPNNPSGAVLTQESLDAVRDAVAGRPIFVICDDVYRQLAYVDDVPSLARCPELREQLIVTQSFSKPYAMTGWRMGYLLADAPVAERLRLVHQYLLSSTPAPFQRACIEALRFDPAPFVATYRRRRDYTVARLRAMGLPVEEPEGAFYAFPSIAGLGLGSDEFCRRATLEAGVAVVPGCCFGADGFVRVSYCVDDDVLTEGLDRLEAFVRGLRP